jgi:hypothetical protein
MSIMRDPPSYQLGCGLSSLSENTATCCTPPPCTSSPYSSMLCIAPPVAELALASALPHRSRARTRVFASPGPTPASAEPLARVRQPRLQRPPRALRSTLAHATGFRCVTARTLAPPARRRSRTAPVVLARSRVPVRAAVTPPMRLGCFAPALQCTWTK